MLIKVKRMRDEHEKKRSLYLWYLSNIQPGSFAVIFSAIAPLVTAVECILQLRPLVTKNVSTSWLKVHYVVLGKIFFLSEEEDSTLTEMFMPKETK